MIKIDRYTIKQELGKGAMGTVYLAKDERLDIIVAIKIFPKSHVNKERFEMETRVIGGLSHPNIVSLLDYGEEEGTLFYVTEYIEGKPLSHLIEKKAPLPVKEVLIIGKEVASALEYAHTHGVIHRDIKPSNIIIAEDGRVFLTDFGVLGLLRSDTHSTQAGEIYGTPVYMSPEQILGKPQSNATDVYGLGMLFFEMLYGQRLFSGENFASLYYKITQAPLTLPSEPAIPEDVEAFVRRCLHKSPDQRPVFPLSEILELLSVESMDTTILRTEPKVLRKKSRPRLIIFAAIPLIAFVALFVFLLVRPPPLTTEGPIKDSFQWLDIRMVKGVFSGVAIALIGIFVGLGLKVWLERIKTVVQSQTEKVLAGAKDRDYLTQSLAIEVEELIIRCRSIDERFLGKTLALMVGEFQYAKSFNNRQTALVNAVEILDKLMSRLSPWYIRYDKLIAILVSMVGIISGLVKVVDTILKAKIG